MCKRSVYKATIPKESAGTFRKSKETVISFILGVIAGIVSTGVYNSVSDKIMAIRHPEYEVGESIVLGQYEQDNDLNNGPEPLEWYVIAKDNNKYLLLSKYILDARNYHDEDEPVSWERCSLREWLNNEFIGNVFTPNESKKIISVSNVNADNSNYSTKGGNSTSDRIFLLSAEEAQKYLTNEVAFGVSTSYAYSKGAFEYNPGYIDDSTETVIVDSFEDGSQVEFGISKESGWLLRTPGYEQNWVTRVRNTYYANQFDNVGIFIDYEGIYVVSQNQGIRPALWYES